MTTPNTDQAAHWNATEASHWVTNDRAYDTMLRPLGDQMLATAAIQPGDRVLDIGCGSGNTTIAAADAAGPHGCAHGLDLSVPMIDLARRRAKEDGVNATFEVADAQVHPLTDASFDVAVSRFGVMFFDDPVAAFTNIGRTLRPGGRLSFVCWQDLVVNDWMFVPGMAIAKHVPIPEPGEPGAPGPFSLADPNRIEEILTAAGFENIGIQAVRAPLALGGGPTVEGTVDFLRDTTMGERFLKGASVDMIQTALTAVTTSLTPFVTPDGVKLDGAAWIVTAQQPTS
jgi:SAM-dependent methyltransferase